MEIKSMIKKELNLIIENLSKKYNIDLPDNLNYQLSESKLPDNLNDEKVYYHLATNLAMILTKSFKLNPHELAQILKIELDKSSIIDRVLISKPAFINIKLSNDFLISSLNKTLANSDNFGKAKINNIKINNEFVSVNPTGFLHFGHARGAAYADSLSKILKYQGYDVESEYYINDAGNQIDILAISTFVRYIELLKEKNLSVKKFEMPEDSYRGEDIKIFAKDLFDEFKTEFENEDLNSITKNKKFKDAAIKIALHYIKSDLKIFNVHHDTWFSERSIEKELIEKTIEKMENHVYSKDGALFLKTSEFGDDKDRVLIKSDGSHTYFLPDIAYHNIKASKSDKMIDFWGADHGGYVRRMQIAMKILGRDLDKFSIEIIQLVRLLKNGSEYKMSKRAGTGIFLRDMIELTSVDAVRWFMVSRDINSPLDFDLDLANSKSDENPVYGVQYAFARSNSLLEKSNEEQYNANHILSEKEQKLLMQIFEFPHVLKSIATNYKVNLLAPYLIDLKNIFNSFYAEEKIINSENEASKLALVKLTNIVFSKALKLIGVSTPKRMG
ncbi:arginyl-tRNA synthetase [Mycoplasma testudineum]|uniref:Arginine--tRNA ligase n=1 Tax=Mycoplasma testudineum TaxID=244584 RepID=A0A4R6IFJ1_9MOLU|nr:arginine--tRNA ligase [Mycoplasma testudineum]OYD26998.1 arginine--tRNA ligase [Mycoplasma testudineum]TDO20546.1 arginyl-tRNA synthetase [Mycoplasma testudineum]